MPVSIIKYNGTGGINSNPTIINIVEGINVKPRTQPSRNNIAYAHIGGLLIKLVIKDFTNGALNR